MYVVWSRLKLQACQAIIQSKVIYGLKTVHLTQAMPKRANAFQFRVFCSVLGLQATIYVSCWNTNGYVLKTASERAGREIKLFANLFNKWAALAGYMLRTSASDPLGQVIDLPNTAREYQIG